jgi:hypothetical protein
MYTIREDSRRDRLDSLGMAVTLDALAQIMMLPGLATIDRIVDAQQMLKNLGYEYRRTE